METKLLNGIEVFTKGDIRNNAIVFIHGNSLNSLSFKKQFELLNDIPLIAINIPGHGNSIRSTEFENVYCLPGYIKAVKDVIKQLELSDYILAGHSLGGHIAIEAAEELNAIKGLFIFGTPPIGMPPQMDQMFHSHPLMNLLFSGEISKEDALSLSNSFIHNPSLHINELSNYILQTDPNTRLNLGASIGKGQFKNELEIINNLNIPVAIGHGRHDAMVNDSYIQQQAFKNLWNKNIIYFENSGHCPQLEEPNEFNKAINEYHHSIFS